MFPIIERKRIKGTLKVKTDKTSELQLAARYFTGTTCSTNARKMND
jgi:hypothetical protein